jgi:hypothetical protein
MVQVNIDGDNAICQKPSVAKAGVCGIGTTEWTPGTCYTDCPQSYLEDGTFCIKSKLVRTVVDAQCSFFLKRTEDGCELDQMTIFMYFLIVIGLWLLIRLITAGSVVDATEQAPELSVPAPVTGPIVQPIVHPMQAASGSGFDRP